MKIAMYLLVALLVSPAIAEPLSASTCPIEATLADGTCMDSDIVATQLEYFAELVQACNSDNPSADRNMIMFEVGVLLNVSKFIPEVGFNGLTHEDVDAIRNETARIVPQYETMKSHLEAHSCN